MTLEFSGPATRLVPGDIEAAATGLGVEPSVVHAVCDVESAGAGFLPDGRPKLLFEAHAFWLATHGRYGQSNISTSSWDRSTYGAAGAHQYDRLAAAIALDRGAALRSASWGAFQIMGSNYGQCGFASIEGFVTAMMVGERQHLDAFAEFVRRNHLDTPLQAMPPRFADFARGYNGPGYAANGYDIKLAAAWRKWRAMPAPRLPATKAPRTDPAAHHAMLQLGSQGEAVVALQEKLGIDADGDFGPETMAAVVAFQKTHMLLTPDGIVGPATRAALGL